MKQSRKIEFFGLLIFLSVALVFLGTSLLDAQVKITGKGGKKPKPEESQYQWQVAIPGMGWENNLFGLTPQSNDDGFIYKETGLGDGYYVEVSKKGRTESQFRLAVFNNRGEFGCNIGLNPWPDGLGERKIGFQNMAIVDWWPADTVEEEYPCFFPTIYSSYPNCMTAFLNNNLQPYCDPACGHPQCSYDYVDIEINVDCDFENITLPHATGIVWIRIVNTYDLQSGCEFPHNISGYCEVEVPDGTILIEKLDGDKWNIKVVEGLFTFAEIYKGKFRGKGNRWEWKIPYWAQIPLTFETTWTRDEVTQ